MSNQYGNGNITALFGGTPFDPNAYEPSKDFEVLPPGKYTCLIESAELMDTKAGTGKYIKVTLRVLEGTYANRKLFDNINVFNPSEDCQKFGIAQLSSIGRAAQCYPVDDTDNLVDKVVIAVVKVKKRKDTGEDQNDVRTYEHPSTATNAQHAPAAEVQHIPATPGRCNTPAPQPVVCTPPTPAAAIPAAAAAPGNAPWKR